MIISIRKAIAGIFGCFWLPCPSCGRMFGGNEVGSRSSTYTKLDGTMLICCNKCKDFNEMDFIHNVALSVNDLCDAMIMCDGEINKDLLDVHATSLLTIR